MLDHFAGRLKEKSVLIHLKFVLVKLSVVRRLKRYEYEMQNVDAKM